ncbi:MAG: hypothetical protein AB7L09_21555 [Nitrospira sp.]
MSKFNFKKEEIAELSSPKEVFDKFGGEFLRGNVSVTIRELSYLGFTTSQISKLLGKRYQHVRNVLKESSKKN